MSGRYGKFLVVFLIALELCACSTPSVDQSQQTLWHRFGNQPIDNVLLSWGAPQGESHLSNGTRILTYRRTRTYARTFAPDFFVYADSAECDATFQAPPPNFKISNITLTGDIFQCDDMAEGASGTASPPAGLY